MTLLAQFRQAGLLRLEPTSGPVRDQSPRRTPRQEPHPAGGDFASLLQHQASPPLGPANPPPEPRERGEAQRPPGSGTSNFSRRYARASRSTPRQSAR